MLACAVLKARIRRRMASHRSAAILSWGNGMLTTQAWLFQVEDLRRAVCFPSAREWPQVMATRLTSVPRPHSAATRSSRWVETSLSARMTLKMLVSRSQTMLRSLPRTMIRRQARAMYFSVAADPRTRLSRCRGERVKVGNRFLMGTADAAVGSAGASNIVGNHSGGVITTVLDFTLADTNGDSTYNLSGSGEIHAGAVLDRRSPAEAWHHESVERRRYLRPRRACR